MFVIHFVFPGNIDEEKKMLQAVQELSEEKKDARELLIQMEEKLKQLGPRLSHWENRWKSLIHLEKMYKSMNSPKETEKLMLKLVKEKKKVESLIDNITRCQVHSN